MYAEFNKQYKKLVDHAKCENCERDVYFEYDLRLKDGIHCPYCEEYIAYTCKERQVILDYHSLTEKLKKEIAELQQKLPRVLKED